MSYRSSQNVILGDTVWHFLRKSYRPLNVVWLSLVKSYLPLPHLLHHRYTHTRIHASPLFLCSSFSSFRLKKLLVTIYKPKILLVTYFHRKISRIAAGFSLSFEPRVTELDRVIAPILTEFLQYCADFVIPGPCFVCLSRFVVD